MKIHFQIHFKTSWGQVLNLFFYDNAGNNSQIFETVGMQCDDKGNWTVEVDFSGKALPIFYRYGVSQPNKTILLETGSLRQIALNEPTNQLRIFDSWRGPYGDTPFNSSVFSNIFFKRERVSFKVNKKGNLLLQLHCPQMEPNRHFAITGNQEALGNWDVSTKVRLDESAYPDWTILLDTKQLTFPLEYKYLIVDTATDEVLAWGGGPNRIVKAADSNEFTIVHDEHFLRTIDSWKAAGVAIPVFSLRSKKSFGIGEFNDLKLMVDWAKRTGQRMIQTLPINDTILYHTNYDSYPYNAVSVYALHPIYLNLEKTGKLRNKERIAWFEAKRTELNDKTFSDYQLVMSTKWEYFLEIFAQDSKKVFAEKEYKLFFEKNKEWLVPYAVFSFLRDLYGTPEFGKWPEYSKYDKFEIEKLANPRSEYYEKISLFYFLQYHLHLQLSEVHDYARANGVAIKGDIPIGVSPRSVDAWVESELFNTEVQAGAPPDDFSVTGQNWGFPTYNWERMAEDGFSWWKKRFAKLAEYFDAYRIDHILGFFRIWEIPNNDVWGLTGNFHPALPYTQREIEQAGIWWNEIRLTKPYLKEHVLYATFGKYTDDVKREYLLPDGWQFYKFKPEYDTQKKIETHFASLGYNFGNKEVLIRDGLYKLHCEVLFLRDLRDPKKYHPRISMHSSATFIDMNEDQRRKLDKLYVEYFYHRHNEFWKEKAYQKLPALISSTNMLVCGEDLGMVPDSVPEVMQSLEILSLEIQRMPKKPNAEFAMPADAPYLSVCTTSTHDMNPIRAWWEEDAAITQRFYNRALGMHGTAPEKCEQWIAEKIVQQHLDSNAMWIILPWQDWMAVESKLCLEHPFAERINVPSNPRNFWCYRMHIPLEKLLRQNKFNDKIKEMVEKAGR